MNKNKKLELLISIGIAELVGLLSGVFAGNSGAFYKTLQLPPLAPPGWVFPVAWTLLYALMGIAAYLVYQSDTDKKQKNNALTVYGIQLFVNFMWSIVFFNLKWLGFSIVVILLLDLLIIIMISLFYNINKYAAYLLLPYLAWALFATYLNIGIYYLNK